MNKAAPQNYHYRGHKSTSHARNVGSDLKATQTRPQRPVPQHKDTLPISVTRTAAHRSQKASGMVETGTKEGRENRTQTAHQWLER